MDNILSNLVEALLYEYSSRKHPVAYEPTHLFSQLTKPLMKNRFANYFSISRLRS